MSQSSKQESVTLKRGVSPKPCGHKCKRLKKVILPTSIVTPKWLCCPNLKLLLKFLLKTFTIFPSHLKIFCSEKVFRIKIISPEWSRHELLRPSLCWQVDSGKTTPATRISGELCERGDGAKLEQETQSEKSQLTVIARHKKRGEESLNRWTAIG